MKPIGNGRPNSGATAGATDLAGEAGKPRHLPSHGRGSGTTATTGHLKRTGAVMRHLTAERKGAGRHARIVD